MQRSVRQIISKLWFLTISAIIYLTCFHVRWHEIFMSDDVCYKSNCLKNIVPDGGNFLLSLYVKIKAYLKFKKFVLFFDIRAIFFSKYFRLVRVSLNNFRFLPPSAGLFEIYYTPWNRSFILIPAKPNLQRVSFTRRKRGLEKTLKEKTTYLSPLLNYSIATWRLEPPCVNGTTQFPAFPS